MVAVFQSAITSEEVKAKAREFGADLAGIAQPRLAVVGTSRMTTQRECEA